MQAAARHPAFISDTTFSSPANITTIDYVNGSSVLVYSSAPISCLCPRRTSCTLQQRVCCDCVHGISASQNARKDWRGALLTLRETGPLSMQMHRRDHLSA